MKRHVLTTGGVGKRQFIIFTNKILFGCMSVNMERILDLRENRVNLRAMSDY